MSDNSKPTNGNTNENTQDLDWLEIDDDLFDEDLDQEFPESAPVSAPNADAEKQDVRAQGKPSGRKNKKKSSSGLLTLGILGLLTSGGAYFLYSNISQTLRTTDETLPVVSMNGEEGKPQEDLTALREAPPLEIPKQENTQETPKNESAQNKIEPMGPDSDFPQPAEPPQADVLTPMPKDDSAQVDLVPLEGEDTFANNTVAQPSPEILPSTETNVAEKLADAASDPLAPKTAPELKPAENLPTDPLSENKLIEQTEKSPVPTDLAPTGNPPPVNDPLALENDPLSPAINLENTENLEEKPYKPAPVEKTAAEQTSTGIPSFSKDAAINPASQADTLNLVEEPSAIQPPEVKLPGTQEKTQINSPQLPAAQETLEQAPLKEEKKTETQNKPALTTETKTVEPNKAEPIEAKPIVAAPKAIETDTTKTQTSPEVTQAPKKPKKAAEPVKVKSVPWKLRSAQPNAAVLYDPSTGNIQSVEVGDKVAGIGRIQSIKMENGRWIVRGTTGKVSQ